jgi:hypothetical protein
MLSRMEPSSYAQWFGNFTYSMKMAVFWVIAPCSLVQVYRRFRGACCLHHQGYRFYQTTLQSRRQPSSYSSPSELEILPNITCFVLLKLTILLPQDYS